MRKIALLGAVYLVITGGLFGAKWIQANTLTDRQLLLLQIPAVKKLEAEIKLRGEESTSFVYWEVNHIDIGGALNPLEIINVVQRGSGKQTFQVIAASVGADLKEFAFLRSDSPFEDFKYIFMGTFDDAGSLQPLPQFLNTFPAEEMAKLEKHAKETVEDVLKNFGILTDADLKTFIESNKLNVQKFKKS